MNKKHSPRTCLFCVNSSATVWKITEEYHGGNTSRYDLTNYLGHQIEPYLKNDDLLCIKCMNFIGYMAYIKRRLIEFLKDRDEAEDIKMQSFSDIWKSFTKFALTSIEFNPKETEDTWETDGDRSQTPNPLVHAYSEPYNQDDETEFTTRGNSCCKSVVSEAYSEADSEVRRLLKSKKRKRRGHHWGRRKGDQKQRALSRPYPSNSFMNGEFHRNCFSSISRERRPSSSRSLGRPPTKRKRRTVEGNSLKTRSVSRLEVHLASVTAKRESHKFYCDVNCPVYFESLDNLVLHKISEHNIIARFKCSQCANVYTTKSELTIHNRIHDTEILHCFQCRTICKGTENLQSHLRQHQEYSIECKFCYLSFLSKIELTEHCSKEHKGKKKKVHEKMTPVFRSVVNYDKINEINRNKNCVGEKQFVSRVLCPDETMSQNLSQRISNPQERPQNGDPVNLPENASIMLTTSTPISINDSPPISISDNSPLSKNNPTPSLTTVISDKETPSEVMNTSSDTVPEEEKSINKESLVETNCLSNCVHIDSSLDSISDFHTEQLTINSQLYHLKPVVILNRLNY